MNNPNTLPKTVLSFILYFLKKERKRISLILLCPIVWSLVTSANPYVLKIVIDTIVNFKGPSANVWTVAATPVLFFIGLQVLLEIAMRLQEWIEYKTIPPIKSQMRETMFNYVQRHSYRFFQEHLSGNLSNKVIDMVRGFENMFIFISYTLLPIIVSVLISVFLLWSVHYWFAAFLLGWFFIYVVITGLLSFNCINISDQHSESNSVLSGKIVDTFRNIATVRMFSKRKFENRYLRRYQMEEVRYAQELGKEMLKIRILQGVCNTSLFSLSLIFYILAWQRGWVTVGDFTFIMSTTFSLMIMTWWLAEEFIIFFKELGLSRQALSMITIPHEITDTPDAKPLIVNEGKIEFNNVTFSYVPHVKLFKNKSIIINPREKVGLVGYSGSGKTTFIQLILRLYDIKNGKILIDNQDISQVTQKSLRNHIALIPQDPMLFHRTLRDNIRYGKENASDNEIIEASKKAACHEFICKQERGYDTVVGEGGIKLSGGQRQRIAIARAILRDVPILILDEATSSLDSTTESSIQQSLWEFMQNRTTILIAHRLSTLSKLDRILVFNEGTIIESGTHQELLQKNGHYAQMWKLQSEI